MPKCTGHEIRARHRHVQSAAPATISAHRNRTTPISCSHHEKPTLGYQNTRFPLRLAPPTKSHRQDRKFTHGNAMRAQSRKAPPDGHGCTRKLNYNGCIRKLNDCIRKLNDCIRKLVFGSYSVVFGNWHSETERLYSETKRLCSETGTVVFGNWTVVLKLEASRRLPDIRKLVFGSWTGVYIREQNTCVWKLENASTFHETTRVYSISLLPLPPTPPLHPRQLSTQVPTKVTFFKDTKNIVSEYDNNRV